MRTVFGTVAAALLAAAPAPAAMVVLGSGTPLGSGEVDVALTFGGALGLELVDVPGGEVAYDPADVLLFVGPAARTAQPANPAFAFIGAGAGNPVWIVPQIENPNVLYLGLEAEDIDPGTFATYFEADPRVSATGEFVRVSFVDVRGPGQFSVWEIGPAGELTVWASTAQGGLTAADAYFTTSGAPDVHLNYGFTAPGLYEVDVVLSTFVRVPGEELLRPVASGPITLTFGVEAGVSAVPEPASCGLLALGGGLLAWRRGRRAA
jgi:hypothetical protein